MKIIKRKKIVVPETVTDKFKEGFKELNNKLRVKEEDILEKIKKSKIWPIVESFYIINPVKNGTKEFWKTKSFNKGLTLTRKALRGTLFNDTEFKAYKDRKFTVEEILESIDTHKLALNPEYKPVDKKYLKISLEQFLYSPYSTSIGKSFFLYWMTNRPAMILQQINDEYPEVTKEIIRMFGFANLDNKDINQIIKGVALFESVLSKEKISPVHRITPQLHAKILHDIIVTIFSFVDVEIQPRNFVSPKMESWIIKGLKDSPYIV